MHPIYAVLIITYSRMNRKQPTLTFPRLFLQISVRICSIMFKTMGFESFIFVCVVEYCRKNNNQAHCIRSYFGLFLCRNPHKYPISGILLRKSCLFSWHETCCIVGAKASVNPATRNRGGNSLCIRRSVIRKQMALAY